MILALNFEASYINMQTNTMILPGLFFLVVRAQRPSYLMLSVPSASVLLLPTKLNNTSTNEDHICLTSFLTP